MKKKFPHYKQPDTKDCGPTCLRIIAKHYKKVIPLQAIRQLSETTREGSSLLGLSEAAEKIGVNRIGTDDYDLKYNGNSKIFDAVGEEIKLNSRKKFIHQTELSAESLKDYRDNFGFLNDRDGFEIF